VTRTAKENPNVDANELRRLAAEVDEEHREAMRTATDDLGELFLGDAARATARNRRAFLRGAGLGGATLTVGALSIALPQLAESAAAQTSSSTTAAAKTTAAATTTTLPPKKPQTDDVAILAFAQSVELAAVAVYGLAAPKISDSAVAAVAAAFAQHHREHAGALNGLVSKSAPGKANAALVAKFTKLVSTASTSNDVLKIAFDLENAAAATYEAALGKLVGTDGAALVASILPIESRHAVVLGQVLNLNLADYAPSVQDDGDALTSSSYPIEG
jgi:rubrerythrin